MPARRRSFARLTARVRCGGFGVVVDGAFAKNPAMVRAIPELRHRYDWCLLDDQESVRFADLLKFLGGYPN